MNDLRYSLHRRAGEKYEKNFLLRKFMNFLSSERWRRTAKEATLQKALIKPFSRNALSFSSIPLLHFCFMKAAVEKHPFNLFEIKRKFSNAKPKWRGSDGGLWLRQTFMKDDSFCPQISCKNTQGKNFLYEL